MKAELISHMGNDLTIVNSARVSFAKECEEIDDNDERLIKYLAKHDHFTPFTHATITLRETVPIFVARQRFKHVVGFTYNEISKRYVDDTPDFYYPNEWRERPDKSVKQGSGGAHSKSSNWSGKYGLYIGTAKRLYEDMINDGVAPEMARMVLPQSMMTSYYVTGSLYAFARAYNLRIDDHAQKEIQDLAVLWDEILEPLFPISWKALT